MEKRTRRVFSPDNKLEIIQRAAQCKHGELGELLRQEGLHSTQLQLWRREYDEGGLEALSKSLPEPKQKKTNEQHQLSSRY
ncbi:MAG: helix-turn-helix domain-containing protein [Gammaproteobacteria bacterium]